MREIKEYLRLSDYQGRGIIVGQTKTQFAFAAYFIMGRSENSRNRLFVQQGEEIGIHYFDKSKLVDPSLIIYSPLRRIGNTVVVTNGDQTDTIYDFLERGGEFAFEKALATRTYEPDPPSFTPRISAVLDFNKNFYYKLSILKRGGGEACQRFFYSYEPVAGTAHFIHTYSGNKTPLPSFCGEPVAVRALNDIDETAQTIWENLDSQNKVSLAAAFYDLKTGKSQTRIINKNKL